MSDVQTESADIDTASVATAVREALGYVPDAPVEAPEAAPEAAEDDSPKTDPDALDEAAEAAPEAEEQPADEGAEEQPTEQPAEDDPTEAVEEVPKWKVAQLHRREASLKRLQQEAKQELETLRQQMQDIAQQKAQMANLADLLRSDPREALDVLAKLNGSTGDQVFETMARRYLGDEEPPAKKASEVDALRQELAELRKEMQEAPKRMRSDMEQRQREQFLASNVADLATIESDPRVADAYPTLAAMAKRAPYRFKDEIQKAVGWAAQERPDLLGSGIANLAAMLEQSAREEYEAIASSFAPPPSKVEQGTRVPAAKVANSRQAKKPQITNGDGARMSGEASSEEDPTRTIAELMRSAGLTTL